MKKLPYFPFYPGEWLRSPTVLGMSLEEQGAYLRLLCVQWEDGYIDPEDLSLLLGVPTDTIEEWFRKRSWKRAFRRNSDGMLVNDRLDLERQQALQKTEMAAAAAHARWRKHREGGKPAKPKRNAETELTAALKQMEAQGAPVMPRLEAAMRAYMEARREGRHRVWSCEQWLRNLDPKFTESELADAYMTAAKAGWASVHPKKAGAQTKGNTALKSLQQWVEHDDLPY